MHCFVLFFILPENESGICYLPQGIGGPVQQFLGLYKVLKETVDALSARESEAEQIRLAIDRPGMIRRDVLAACAEVFAPVMMCHIGVTVKAKAACSLLLGEAERLTRNFPGG